MPRCIVYTRHSDGGVSVCTPTDWMIAVMSCGGLWSDRPRGFGDIQIERQIALGIQPDAARRYVKAVQYGGLTTAEAHAVIRDRDCAHLGHSLEMADHADLPDRWFRNAWRQGHNGGITIDLKLARPIQWRRARNAVAKENKRRTEAFERVEPIDVDWEQIRSAIRRASNVEDLRRIWILS